jgi:hypothetical protein
VRHACCLGLACKRASLHRFDAVSHRCPRGVAPGAAREAAAGCRVFRRSSSALEHLRWMRPRRIARRQVMPAPSRSSRKNTAERARRACSMKIAPELGWAAASRNAASAGRAVFQPTDDEPEHAGMQSLGNAPATRLRRPRALARLTFCSRRARARTTARPNALVRRPTPTLRDRVAHTGASGGALVTPASGRTARDGRERPRGGARDAADSTRAGGRAAHSGRALRICGRPASGGASPCRARSRRPPTRDTWVRRTGREWPSLQANHSRW